MRVKELIKRLETYRQDLIVKISVKCLDEQSWVADGDVEVFLEKDGILYISDED